MTLHGQNHIKWFYDSWSLTYKTEVTVSAIMYNKQFNTINITDIPLFWGKSFLGKCQFQVQIYTCF